MRRNARSVEGFGECARETAQAVWGSSFLHLTGTWLHAKSPPPKNGGQSPEQTNAGGRAIHHFTQSGMTTLTKDTVNFRSFPTKARQ